LEAGERGGRPGVGGRGAPEEARLGRASLGPSPSSPRRRARARVAHAPQLPSPPLATRWQVTASEPKRPKTCRAGSAANWPSVVDPRRWRVTAEVRPAQDRHGPRREELGRRPLRDDEEVRAARMPANSHRRCRRARSPPGDLGEGGGKLPREASLTPKKRLGPRAGTVQMPRRTGLTHGQNRSTAAMTSRNALGRRPAPLVEQRRAPHHQRNGARLIHPVAIGRRRHGRRDAEAVALGGTPVAPTGDLHLGTALAQVPVPGTRSPPRSTRAPGAPRRHLGQWRWWSTTTTSAALRSRQRLTRWLPG